MVATRLQTLDNEKVTIANTEVLKAEIVNYSAATALGGLLLRVAVGIGYDTEWRQVYELLLKAAAKTDGVGADPAPMVYQTDLDDFAVTYTLVACLEDPKRRLLTRSALRENIQDVFNEAGIEIMTPSVRAIRNSLDPAIPGQYVGDPVADSRFRIDSAAQGASE